VSDEKERDQPMGAVGPFLGGKRSAGTVRGGQELSAKMCPTVRPVDGRQPSGEVPVDHGRPRHPAGAGDPSSSSAV